MEYGLPKTVNVGGVDYDIRSDFRAVLDIYAALNDADLEPDVRAYEVLHIFYTDADAIPDEEQQEAVDKCLTFLQGGHQQPRTGAKEPRLIDWEQDYPLIVGPVNRVLGQEVRALDYMHWWTFLDAYYEIGDCLFAQIVSIRDKISKGKSLDKTDREFYRRNKDLIDIKQAVSHEEQATLNAWLHPAKKGGLDDAER